MPGRYRNTTRPEVNADYKFRILDVLNNAQDAITLDEIRMDDIILRPLSNQKISRLISELIDFGLVQKGKSKSLGRMVYKTTARMQEEGYEVADPVVPPEFEHQYLHHQYTTHNWELEEEEKLKERID